MKLLVAFVASGIGASAYTSNNGVMTPGNENFPAEGGFQHAEVEANMPVVNVKYRFPAADAGAYLASLEDRVNFDRRVSEILGAVKQDEYMMKSSFLKGAGEDIVQTVGTAKPDSLGDAFDSGVLRDLGAAPAKRASAQATVAETEGSCARDYSAACPNGFALSNGKCAATSYAGPCAGEAHDFSTFSLAAKKRFSSQCGAFFPCSTCTRNFAGCPEGFSASGSKCVAGASYTGPCGDADFTGFNANMLKRWGDLCQASWSCA
jgi:CPW-WPC domain-containing protein